MTLTILRDHSVDITEREVNFSAEEIYEEVENIYMEMKTVKKYDLNGNTIPCKLILFNDKNHKGLLNKNYVYVSQKDTIEIK